MSGDLTCPAVGVTITGCGTCGQTKQTAGCSVCDGSHCITNPGTSASCGPTKECAACSDGIAKCTSCNQSGSTKYCMNDKSASSGNCKAIGTTCSECSATDVQCTTCEGTNCWVSGDLTCPAVGVTITGCGTCGQTKQTAGCSVCDGSHCITNPGTSASCGPTKECAACSDGIAKCTSCNQSGSTKYCMNDKSASSGNCKAIGTTCSECSATDVQCTTCEGTNCWVSGDLTCPAVGVTIDGCGTCGQTQQTAGCSACAPPYCWSDGGACDGILGSHCSTCSQSSPENLCEGCTAPHCWSDGGACDGILGPHCSTCSQSSPENLCEMCTLTADPHLFCYNQTAKKCVQMATTYCSKCPIYKFCSEGFKCHTCTVPNSASETQWCCADL